MSINNVVILGNLGRTPSLRTLKDGKVTTTLSVATNEDFTNSKGERQTNTEWHQVVVWGKVAENCCKYLTKGRSVSVVGRLHTRTFKDKNSTTHYVTEVVAAHVHFEGSASSKSQGTQGEAAGQSEIPPEMLQNQQEEVPALHLQDVDVG